MLVLSLSWTRTTFSPLPQVSVYSVKAHESASKWGSGNSLSPCSKPLKLNISGDRARMTVKSSDWGSYIPNYKTTISDKITCWEGEQFPLIVFITTYNGEFA